MDLLGNDNKKEEKSKSKKVVGGLLITSIILFILIIILIMVLKTTQSKKITYKLLINDKEINSSTLKTTEEAKYISLEDIAQNLGYTYYNGEYLGQATEERINCYLKNKNEVICFKINTMEVYKTTEDSIIEKQMYKTQYNVINNEGKISMAIEDFGIIFNTIMTYDEKNAKIDIYTNDYLAQKYKDDINNNKLSINLNESFENLKAISKNMLVIVKDGQYGVVDTNFKTIIGNKYSSMKYDEYTNTFLVSDSNNKYGVITDKGDGKISLKYDSISIISYEPLLYAITKNQKYGVIDEMENITVNIEFEKLACMGNARNNTESVLIIPKVYNDEYGIVVNKNSKYGIVNLLKGNVILDCIVDAINSRTDERGTKEYFVKVNDEEIELKKYIKSINTVTVNLSNTISNKISE